MDIRFCYISSLITLKSMSQRYPSLITHCFLTDFYMSSSFFTENWLSHRFEIAWIWIHLMHFIKSNFWKHTLDCNGWLIRFVSKKFNKNSHSFYFFFIKDSFSFFILWLNWFLCYFISLRFDLFEETIGNDNSFRSKIRVSFTHSCFKLPKFKITELLFLEF